MERRTIFQTLDGRPAQILVIAGLALVLLTPLIPRFRYAAVESARSASDNAEAMIELEMEEIIREQELEVKKNNEAVAGMPWDQQQASAEARQKRITELQRLAEEKREELRKRFDRAQLKRSYLEAQRNAAGMRWHLLVGWLGNVLLIVGLLALTATASGVTQKVFLIILLLVMFSALSGVRVDFLAAGQMGGDESRSFIESIQPGRR
ncbi:MAG TPA: hypothetical protein VMS12_05790 [Thermoanaerobaculia bacterium]|nr:hypothetical protein [Thermoanaerobaculia bacterium]